MKREKLPTNTMLGFKVKVYSHLRMNFIMVFSPLCLKGFLGSWRQDQFTMEEVLHLHIAA